MNQTRAFLFGISMIGLASCVDEPRENNQPVRATLSADNGSWGNGSWGNGTWGNGSWGNGSWGNGTWGNGSWGNGTWGNGSWGNGTWGNGTWGNGSWGNGTWGNGTWGNGTWGNGTWGNGSWGNGTWGNGTWGNGMLFSNLSVPSLDISNLVDTSLSSSGCAAGMDPAAAMTEFMVYVATIRCALPASCAENDTACMSQIDCATDSNCRVITDCDGNELYVSGRDGLGTNQSDPGVVAAVDACIDATLAELNTEFRAYADNLNSYAASCALPASTGGSCSQDPGCVEVTYQLYPSGTETKQYYGGVGLAPTWKSNPDFDQDPVGQRRVSACLAARTNPHKKKVQISIRGLGIPTTETEKHIYGQHEGAFWGNRFGATPSVHVCSVDGGGISGRLCSGGECGFVDHGDCATACTSTDSEGNYTECDGQTDVINTFLPFMRRLSNGWDHRCVVRADDTTWCFGLGDTYQLGNGNRSNSATPVQAAALGTSAVELSVGKRHSCARKDDGSVWCWGSNVYGRVGDGSSVTEKQQQPSHVAVLGYDVAQLNAGNEHNCAVKTDGTVWCWGLNEFDQLGGAQPQSCVQTNRTWECNKTPVQVTGLTGAIKADVGQKFSCALKNDGSLWCWGANGQGKLGTGNYNRQSTPALVGLPGSVVDFDLGHKHSCALDSAGGVWCWGQNDEGQVGDNQANSDSKGNVLSPVLVTGLPYGATHIETGAYHTCATLTDASVWCWGDNVNGQLGVGDTDGRLVPTLVSLPGLATDMVATDEQSQVILEDGSVYSFGSNFYGQLGTTTTEICSGSGYQVPCATSPLRMTVLDNCGDGICDFGESHAVCAADCPAN